MRRYQHDSQWINSYGTFNLGEEHRTFKDAVNWVYQDTLEAAGDPHEIRGNATAEADYRKLINTMAGVNGYFDQDTQTGGNSVINPNWQFCSNDDLVWPITSILKTTSPEGVGTNGSSSPDGLGSVYADVYQRNQQILWLSFGNIRYTGSLHYFSNAADAETSAMVKHGDFSIHAIAAKIGKIGVGVVKLAIAWPIYTVKFMARMTGLIDGSARPSKYAIFEDSMLLYYRSVQTILTSLAVSMGIMPDGGGKNKINSYQDAAMSNAFRCGIDVIALQTRRMRRRARQKAIADPGDINLEDTELTAADGEQYLTVDALFEDSTKGKNSKYFGQEIKTSKEEFFRTGSSDKDRFAKVMAKAGGQALAIGNVEAEADSNTAKYKEELKKEKEGGDDLLYKGFTGGIKDGLGRFIKYVGLRIDKGEYAAENISNSVGESSMAENFKSASLSAADKQYTVGRFQSSSGWLGAIKTGVDSVMNVVGGVLGSVGLGSTYEIATGNGFYDLPQQWKGSSFDRSYSFNIKLDSPLGDPVSVFENVYYPFAFILAGCLPRPLGKSMYTAPFYCKAYCKGMFAVPLGMMSCSVTRGASEYGFTKAGLPKSIDISITINDLSPVLFLGIMNANLPEIFQSNTGLIEYLDTLSCLSLNAKEMDLDSMLRRSKVVLSMRKKTTFNPYWWGLRVGNSKLGTTIHRVSYNMKTYKDKLIPSSVKTMFRKVMGPTLMIPIDATASKADDYNLGRNNAGS